MAFPMRQPGAYFRAIEDETHVLVAVRTVLCHDAQRCRVCMTRCLILLIIGHGASLGMPLVEVLQAC